jgi:hypothetical protein
MAVLLILVGGFESPASAEQGMVQVVVPGTSDPWLAGMPDSSTASGEDHAPEQSPVLVDSVCMIPGDSLSFEATGGVNYEPGGTLHPPDGHPTYMIDHWGPGVENGISNIYAPTCCLVGVFLDDSQPDGSPAPDSLDFGTMAARDYLSLSPELKQVFFIGDGVTSGAQQQYVIVPTGATRLFLGTMDGYGWWNNEGEFVVLVMSQICSEAGIRAESAEFEVGPAAPNPLRDCTMISFSSAEPGNVTVSIYSVTGQLVTTLADGWTEAGAHKVVWKGTDQAGEPVARGVYLCRIETGTRSATTKVVVLD